MKTAIVHEWLVTFGGSERVVEQVLTLYPDADLFTLVDFLPAADRGFLKNTRIQTSFIQKLPLAKKYYRQYLPCMPLAVEQFDLSQYDLIISSNHAVAKGVLTGPDQLHVSYIHTPIRYAWDMQHQYLRESGLHKGLMSCPTRLLLHYIRLWDYRTANNVDQFAANSHFIARRIWKVYRRDAHVIYPPVNITDFTFSGNKKDYYLAASRMVPYKKMDLIVEAFNRMPDKRLVVIGNGPGLKKVKARAHKNIDVLGYQSTETLCHYMQEAKAFVFAAQEDFGITPLEAQACGTPVIAFGRGGSLETIRGLDFVYPTGVFFKEQTVESLIDGVNLFEANRNKIRSTVCRQNAERFSAQRFRSEFGKFVDESWQAFKKVTK
ncbi:MAG: glycosyltransferase family 4 protein [Anaerolineales bacterium]|nr:glycosyltransferase family 4 protein [Anaerolineales bacterium]